MKTKEEILQGRYVIDGYVFGNDTPKKLANLIISLINRRERIVLDYGDIKTNISWNEKYNVAGYIGYCRGAHELKYPILVHNKRSIGGGLILTDCIIAIRTSQGKRLIYQNEISK